jgi:hypothetical protein
MIVSLHVASGAAIGAAVRSRRAAVGLGLLAHAVGDRIPHRDIASRRFELRSGAALLLLVALRRGLLDPATLGGAAAAAPDVEHVLRLPRPGGRKLFPSHRFHGWHRAGGLPAWLQLLAAGVLAGVVVSRGDRQGP